MLETKFTKGQWLNRKLFETPTLVKDKEGDREWFYNQISIYDPNDNGRIICDVQFATDCNGMGWGHNETTEKWEANALLISKSPQMLEMLQESVIDLKILKSNIAFAAQNDNKFEGMPELIQKWIDAKEALIKSATEI